jgi:hypothetical protein
MKWYELRASTASASGVALGSSPRVVVPVNSMLMVYDTSSMCEYSSARDVRDQVIERPPL